MKNYCAFDGVNMEFELFESIEEAREWLKEGFLDDAEGYHPDMTSCAIYKLAEVVDYDVIDKKENHSEEEWNEIIWDKDIKEIWQHKFVPITIMK